MKKTVKWTLIAVVALAVVAASVVLSLSATPKANVDLANEPSVVELLQQSPAPLALPTWLPRDFTLTSASVEAVDQGHQAILVLSRADGGRITVTSSHSSPALVPGAAEPVIVQLTHDSGQLYQVSTNEVITRQLVFVKENTNVSIVSDHLTETEIIRIGSMITLLPSKYLPPEDPLAGLTGQIYAYCQTFGGDIWLVDEQGAQVRLTSYGDVSDFTWSPDGQHILFTRYNNSNLWLVELSTKTIQSFSAYHSPGHWHPGGDKIAYVSEPGVITIIGLDGTEHQIELDHALEPKWHPGGELLAVRLTDQGYVFLNAEGQEVFRLADAMSIYWLEDGLVYLRFSLEAPPYSQPDDPYYYQQSTNLVHVDMEGNIIKEIPYRQENVTASPSARHITFTDEKTLSLWDLETGRVSILLEQDVVDTGSDYWETIPLLWSPAEDVLACFRYTAYGDDRDGYLDLVLIDVVSGEPSVLWPEIYLFNWDEHPPYYSRRLPALWSPDGKHLIVAHNYNYSEGVYDLYRVDVETGARELWLGQMPALPVAQPGS